MNYKEKISEKYLNYILKYLIKFGFNKGLLKHVTFTVQHI